MRRVRQRRGVRLPAGVMSVARPSRWGNPFRMADPVDRAEVLARYRSWLDERLADDPKFLDPLRGATGVACYCPLDVACHADLIIARLAETEKQA